MAKQELSHLIDAKGRFYGLGFSSKNELGLETKPSELISMEEIVREQMMTPGRAILIINLSPKEGSPWIDLKKEYVLLTPYILEEVSELGIEAIDNFTEIIAREIIDSNRTIIFNYNG